MAINTNTNSYTVLFSIGLVVVVGILLSVAAVSLKSKQDANVRLEKMQNILKSINVNVDREKAEKYFNKYIKNQISLDVNGNILDDVDAFKIDLAKEVKKKINKQILPVFLAEKDNRTFYIIPLYGNGLWDSIWGYISLEEDKNTVYGATFDHVRETPGLGAEITQSYFQNQFKNEKIFSPSGNFEGIIVKKGNNDPEGKDKKDHEVDALAGATITGNGVTKMIKNRLELYLPYFKKN